MIYIPLKLDTIDPSPDVIDVDKLRLINKTIFGNVARININHYQDVNRILESYVKKGTQSQTQMNIKEESRGKMLGLAAASIWKVYALQTNNTLSSIYMPGSLVNFGGCSTAV